MATFLPSPIVGSISGPIGALEFAHGRSGNIIKSARRRRSFRTAAQYDHGRILQILGQMWHDASSAMRKSWTTYASTQTTTNRWAQQVTAKPYQTCINYHLYILQWLDMVIPDPLVLQPPPMSSPLPGRMTYMSANFWATPSYIVYSNLNSVLDHREFLWAGPSRNESWSGRTNWRFIGCQAKTQYDMDWTSYFSNARTNWAPQAGTWVWLKVAHSLAGYVTGLNTPFYKAIKIIP
jgi:hypothetical protein